MRLRILLAVALILAAGLCVYKFSRSTERLRAKEARPTAAAEAPKPGRNRLMQYMESPSGDAVPGLFVVISDSESDFSQFHADAKKQGLDVVSDCEAMRIALVSAPDADSRAALCKILPPRSLLEYDFVSRSPEMPLSSTAQDGFGKDAPASIGCPDDADWGRGVSLALLDEAVVAHPELASSTIVRFGDSAPTQAGSHGTAMASIICGRGEGVSGVARSVRLINFVVSDAGGTGDSFRIAKGISDAIDAGASVICCESLVSGDSKALRLAVRRAVDSNVIVVAPVSSGGDLVYPAAIPEVLSVAAVDRSGVPVGTPRTGYSLVAPGAGLSVALPGGSVGPADGTGPAAALVSASLAGILGENPGLGAYPAAELLRNYADRSGLDSDMGSGIVNLARVRNRTVQGLRDIAVTGVDFTPDAHGGGTARVAVQNKGTATTAFILEVTSAGRVYRFPNPGLAGNHFEIYSVAIPDAGDGQISANAVTQVADMNPDNNVW
ncbi:MAG TPA: S8 family serine peptidase [Opitutales bacterium]|nr:S8 family serine peptidase [Opitutales bacterium]